MDLLEPENLALLFSKLPPHCIVLLEDVDAAGIGQDKSTSRVTLSGLLNVLNEGRVLVITTNHIEHLDEALIRPSRVDKKLADKKISTQLFHTVYKQTADYKESKYKFSNKAIERLANNFASKVLDQIFSPAKVLSFLLEQKNSPFSVVTSIKN
ncbi:hypothetical protein N7537_010173 [Penicillium hordei]|uniref:ATPase AAA-type core domain-containing protein n=1 Tax=Penicillium hordei TaxID=40994 RepID=A0AAD6DU60_9EURO|nr:uncharacterized protein N7537_010173 [Penicillium hordei]KAJ5593269.1 hypothetical protein N7537_010173 [Penicillium hordei]